MHSDELYFEACSVLLVLKSFSQLINNCTHSSWAYLEFNDTLRSSLQFFSESEGKHWTPLEDGHKAP